MPEFLKDLFSSDGFMPHGHCYLWNPQLVWLHVISDALTALAYTSIPFTLVYFVRKRRDVPFNWIFLCFGMFIIACGATHYMEIWTLWTPTYWLSGVVKAITAVASVPTAVLLIRLMPQALAIPTPEQLSKAHADLELRKERESNLKASLQVRDDFLATAGHELKTPLAALLMQIQSLQRAVQKDPTVRVGDRLEKAAMSGLRLERLINQLLDVSRITAGRLRLEPEPVNLSEVVKEVVARFTEANVKTDSPITVHFDGPVNGLWDRLRIEQVINNLIGNAVKYGQGKPVEIDLRMESGHAVLRVTDRGIGIDDEQQKKIFQRFERAVATRDFGGFGLGLWITRQIAEASGGRIEVQSVLGQGSTFIVRLPMNQEESPSKVGHEGK